ncbi:unnamed protein product [Cylindrotheca closterium]|uniref:BZIP domain-containing protein n=1 Tax=Cylindrotheca closterium TaxID=2856 RepID=A0AAD2G2Y9_9STRA|nr:unnamed protein product [Cylindrotheca closterium]
MKNIPDPRKIDDEASPKRQKSSARRISTTQSESQESTGKQATLATNHDVTLQEGESRVSEPAYGREKETQSQGQPGQEGNESQTWTAVRQDRDRRMRIRKIQKEQLGFLESENMRLSASNNSLRYHNSHLKDTIERIKNECDSSKKPAAAVGSSTACPAQKIPIIPHNLNQQQLALLLLGNDIITREAHQEVSHMADTFVSRPGLDSTMGLGSSSVPSFGRSEKQQIYCCSVYAVYCALDPALKQVFRGDSHDPSCQNHRR